MQVYEEEMSKCSDIIPRTLSLKWHEKGEPKHLELMITLHGSIGPKVLRLLYPPPSPGKIMNIYIYPDECSLLTHPIICYSCTSGS